MLATLPGAKILASPKCSEKWVSISSSRRANGDHSSLLFAGVVDPRPDSPRRPPAPPTLSEIVWETVCPHRDKFYRLEVTRNDERSQLPSCLGTSSEPFTKVSIFG